MTFLENVRSLLPPRYREFAKYITVGATAWVIDAAIYTALIGTVMPNESVWAKVISMLISTVYSYILNRQWSFNTRGGRRLRSEATLFFIFNGLAFLINLVPLVLTHYIFGIRVAGGYPRLTVTLVDWVMANIVGTFIAMIFRYWSYRKFVFPKKSSPAS